MAKKGTYQDYIKQEMSDLIEKVDLSDLQRRFMKSRWLDQVLWLESKSTRSRNRHYMLRLITIIGGVIVPALVSVNSANVRELKLREIFGWTAFGLSQAVAISAAVEELFHYGENYRRYRNSAEAMKIEGWQFFQLSGPYRDAKNHEEAYPTFAANVENIIQQDVEGYISHATQTDAESKAATNAAIAQNLALANMQLREQLQQPPPPPPQLSPSPAAQSPANGTQPSSPDTWYDEGEGEDEFVTPATLRSGQFGQPTSPGNVGSTSPFPTSLPSVEYDEGEDDFVTPDQIKAAPFPGSVSNGGVAPNSTVMSTATLTMTTTQTVAKVGDEDDFISSDQIRGTQPGASVTPAAIAPPPTPVAQPAPPPCVPPLTTPEVVADILNCPLKDTQTYLPGVMAALQEWKILDKPTLIAAIATIGVETGGFRPIHEYGGDDYFTTHYEWREDLGNTQAGDGARYHGRGFIQITGRANYRDYGQKLGLGTKLEENPDLTLEPTISGRILACYFYDRQVDQAAKEGDWRGVRRLVNGGDNGWDDFYYFVQRALDKI